MKKINLEIINNEPMIGTFELCKMFEVDHRYTKRLIDNYKKDFEEVGDAPVLERKREGHLRFENASKKKSLGPPVIEYVLNEYQYTFLLTLVRAKWDGPVLEFKKWLSKEFIRQRKLINRLLTQKENAEWVAKRDAGKIERRKETDTIKRFIEYAKSQGSQNASKYYMIITKMQNKSLFSLDFLEQKYPTIREIANGFSLDALKMSDHIVDRAIYEGMERELPYKEIYELAKDRVEAYASAIGKCPLSAVVNRAKPLLV